MQTFYAAVLKSTPIMFFDGNTYIEHNGKLFKHVNGYTVLAIAGSAYAEQCASVCMRSGAELVELEADRIPAGIDFIKELTGE